MAQFIHRLCKCGADMGRPFSLWIMKGVVIYYACPYCGRSVANLFSFHK